MSENNAGSLQNQYMRRQMDLYMKNNADNVKMIEKQEAILKIQTQMHANELDHYSTDLESTNLLKALVEVTKVQAKYGFGMGGSSGGSSSKSGSKYAYEGAINQSIENVQKELVQPLEVVAERAGQLAEFTDRVFTPNTRQGGDDQAIATAKSVLSSLTGVSSWEGLILKVITLVDNLLGITNTWNQLVGPWIQAITTTISAETMKNSIESVVKLFDTLNDPKVQDLLTALGQTNALFLNAGIDGLGTTLTLIANGMEIITNLLKGAVEIGNRIGDIPKLVGEGIKQIFTSGYEGRFGT